MCLNSPSSRRDTINLMAEEVEVLVKFPEIGRPGRIEGTRERVVSRAPYIAAYRIQGDTVRSLRVLAQPWPDFEG